MTSHKHKKYRARSRKNTVTKKTRRRQRIPSPSSPISTGNTTHAEIIKGIKHITRLEMMEDYQRLVSEECDKSMNHVRKVGNNVMDYYFFKHRINTKSKRGNTYFDWIKTPWQTNEAEYRMYNFNLAQGKTPEKARYGVFRLYYGAINGFKPLIAKWLFCKYNPNTIVDFSAGWGGRCIAAMSLGKKYIGFDTNTDLQSAYNRMIHDLNPAITPHIYFRDSATVDFSKYKYDMVFTSPPYFKTQRPTEGYAHMPEYKDRDDFNARFLFPVIERTYANLSTGGIYALNIPADMYEDIKNAMIIPSKLYAKHPMYVQPRFARGNPLDVASNQEDAVENIYKEYIYVWKKV
jgi:hypothetical protein